MKRLAQCERLLPFASKNAIDLEFDHRSCLSPSMGIRLQGAIGFAIGFDSAVPTPGLEQYGILLALLPVRRAVIYSWSGIINCVCYDGSAFIFRLRLIN